MNQKQIRNFVRKVNYNIPIKIKFLSKKESKIQKQQHLTCAMASSTRYLNDNNELIVLSFIEINRNWKKYIRNNEFKAVLLHEVGHFYTGYKILNNKLILKPIHLCEFEAQKWALQRAKRLKFKQIRRTILELFYCWSLFKWKSHERPYLHAYKLAVKEGILK